MALIVDPVPAVRHRRVADARERVPGPRCCRGGIGTCSPSQATAARSAPLRKVLLTCLHPFAYTDAASSPWFPGDDGAAVLSGALEPAEPRLLRSKRAPVVGRAGPGKFG